VALIAALVAHVVIDVLGDGLLARDSYDNVVHGSRGYAAFGALALVFVCATAVVRAALREARGSDGALCSLVRAALPADGRTFGSFVIGLTPGFVAAMGALDAALAGAHLASLADLFGGSMLLGLSVSTFVAALCAAGAWSGLRHVARIRAALVHVVVAWLRALAPHGRVRADALFRYNHVALAGVIAPHRIAGRAPPLHVASVR